jgi:hypothetical protein
LTSFKSFWPLHPLVCATVYASHCSI